MPSLRFLLSSLSLFSLTQPGLALEADQVFELASPSVVRVVASINAGFGFKYGSGVAIAPETVITNCHVVDQGNGIKVSAQKREFIANLQFADLERDLCQLSVPGLQVPAAKFTDTPKLRIGQRVYVIGSPEGVELTLSDGLLSGFRGREPKRLIQTSAPITHGSSGGGLFDAQARLIGIANAGTKEEAGLNLAIPVEYISELPKRIQEAKVLAQVKIASAQTSVTAATGSDNKSTTEVRKLTFEEIQKHFSAGRVLLLNEKSNPVELSFPRGGREVRRYCFGCRVKSDYSSLKFKSAINQVCFQWDIATYPNDGCFGVSQLSEGLFRLDPAVNGAAMEYRVIK